MSNKPWLKKASEDKSVTVMGANIKVRKLSFGESREIVNKATKVDYKKQTSTVDSTLLGVLRCIAMIKEWDITDENENVLPITLDTFDNVLDEEFAGAVIEAVLVEDGGSVSEQEKK
jgi:hypothetical protein